jgi:phosphoribosylformylglycinamidine cyclo-ligase
MNYEQAGVNYDRLDAFKRACQRAAATTTGALGAHGLSEPAAIRGESAYLIEAPDEYLAHVEEGLGTKNLIADAMRRLTGQSFYRNVGVDTVATIVNDLITTGACRCRSRCTRRWATGSGSPTPGGRRTWRRDSPRGCAQSGAVWGGGETPALKGSSTRTPSCSPGRRSGASGPSPPHQGDVRDGDVMVFLASSGVQTNGLTLCRAIADRLPQGYLTPIADGRSYGEALLDASVIYVSSSPAPARGRAAALRGARDGARVAESSCDSRSRSSTA